jgi:hypothetical protein
MENVMQIKKMKALCAAVGLGLCIHVGGALAQNFAAPGYHNYTLVSPWTVQGDLRYGRDYVLGGKPTLTWDTTKKLGYVPISLSEPSGPCNAGGCYIGTSVSASSCTTQESSYGMVVSGDVLTAINLTLSRSTTFTYKSCSASNSEYGKTIAAGEIPTTHHTYAVIAMGYRAATAKFLSKRIYFSPKIIASASDSYYWPAVYSLCRNFGWTNSSGGAGTVANVRDIVKQLGYCYTGANGTTVEARDNGGAYPYNRAGFYHTIYNNQFLTVGKFRYPSAGGSGQQWGGY